MPGLNKKEKIKEYKSTRQPMGIIAIKNKRSNRTYLTASMNMPGTINSIKFQLNLGNFPPSPDLARDWRDFGEASFSFETLDTLDPKDGTDSSYQAELDLLKSIWQEKLQKNNMY